METNFILAFLVLGLALLFLAFFFFVARLRGRLHREEGRKKVEAILASSPYRQRQELRRPNNDIRARDKLTEKRQQEALETGVVQYDPHGLAKEEVEETQIVGLAEPNGFWTRFIMGQKMQYILNRMAFQKSGKGFWVNLIKAQSASQGRDQSRGR